MKKILAASAAALLGGGALLGIAAPAWADDVVPAPEPAVTEVVTSDPAPEVVPETAPAPAPEPAPIVDGSVTGDLTTEEVIVEEEAVVSAKTESVNEKLPICHSGGGANWTYIAPDAQGYNGHKNHELDIYGLSEKECLAKNDTTVPNETLTLTWKLPNGGTPGNVTWPQPVADPNALECGVWYQQDTYKYSTKKEVKIVDALDDDGVLSQGEDYDVVISWKFIYGGDCAPPTAVYEVPTYECGPLVAPSDTEYVTFEAQTDGDAGRIIVRAKDGYVLASGESKDVFRFTLVECPPDQPNHKVTGSDSCGAWEATLYNPSTSDNGQMTASYVVWVDGSFFGAYAVMEDATEVTGGTFLEDSGLHDIRIEAGAAQGGAVLLELNDIESDCIPPQPEDKVEYGEWTDAECGEDTETRTVTTTTYSLVEGQWVANEPVVTTETRTVEVTPCPTDTPEPPTGGLALTGADPTVPLMVAGGVLLLGAALVAPVEIRRRRALKSQQ